MAGETVLVAGICVNLTSGVSVGGLFREVFEKRAKNGVKCKLVCCGTILVHMCV